MLRKCTLCVTLAVLLLTPALPAWADSGPGLFHWLPDWLLSWATGEHGPRIDPFGVEAAGGKEGPKIDPSGLNVNGGDVGPTIDPSGLQDDECTEGSSTTGGEHGPCIDPMG